MKIEIDDLVKFEFKKTETGILIKIQKRIDDEILKRLNSASLLKKPSIIEKFFSKVFSKKKKFYPED